MIQGFGIQENRKYGRLKKAQTNKRKNRKRKNDQTKPKIKIQTTKQKYF